MHNIKKYRIEILFATILFIFVLIKLSVLSLPYFWDELGVYSRAALYLHDNGISLMPKALPPELSRGHPLFFSFIYAVSFKLFGDTLLTGHITSLVISLAFILSLYFILKSQFQNKNLALAVAVFVLIQPVFIAQSVMVLPEILLAMFMLLSVHCFSRKKYVQYALFSSLAILVKETAIILPFAVICADLFIAIANRKKINRILSVSHLIAFFPFVVFGIFLLIQKQQNGWYFFPYHISAVSIRADVFFMQFQDYCKFITMEQGRMSFTIILFVAYCMNIALNKKKLRHPVFEYLSCLLLLCTLWFLYNDNDLAFLISFSMFCMLFIFLRMKLNTFQPFNMYLFVLALGGLLFSSINFYMNRYIIFILPAFMCLFCLYSGSRIRNDAVLLFLLVGFGVISYLNIESKTFHYDEDMSYVKYIEQQQSAMQYMENKLTGREINVFANFPLYHGFTDTRLGYTTLKDDKDFHLIKANKRTTAFNYILIADPGSYDHILPAADSIAIEKEFENAIGNITIYKAND